MPKLPQRELDRLIDAAMDHAQKEIGGPGASMQAGYDAMEATGAYFRFNNVAWPKTLELATFYGWEPEHDEQYYLPKGNQVVSAEDANNLAAALERAVAAFVANRVHAPFSRRAAPRPSTARTNTART